mmetsp:Transcript_100176/g.323125  ORF Transcript_100176/g.323125 Transcript_100176/m.323125 type:complete len:415 (+) Transcript_100176:205-1449(+)
MEQFPQQDFVWGQTGDSTGQDGQEGGWGAAEGVEQCGLEGQPLWDQGAGCCEGDAAAAGSDAWQTLDPSQWENHEAGSSMQSSAVEPTDLHNGEETNEEAGEGATSTATSVSLPKESFVHVIGPGGARIKEIRQQSRADVFVKKLEDRCEVLITGTAEQVQQAQDLVNSSVEAGKRDAEQRRWVQEEEDPADDWSMTMSREEAKQIIGRSGAVVKQIRTDSGASVKVEEKIDPGSVHVTGTIKAVDRARVMIYEVLGGNLSSSRRGKLEFEDEEFMKISYGDSKRLIGKAGSKVGEIEKKSWAKVEVAKSTGEPVLVRIVGSFDAVEQACSLIEEALPGTFQSRKGADPHRKRKWNDDEWQEWRAGEKKNAAEQDQQWPGSQWCDGQWNGESWGGEGSTGEADAAPDQAASCGW